MDSKPTVVLVHFDQMFQKPKTWEMFLERNLCKSWPCNQKRFSFLLSIHILCLFLFFIVTHRCFGLITNVFDVFMLLMLVSMSMMLPCICLIYICIGLIFCLSKYVKSLIELDDFVGVLSHRYRNECHWCVNDVFILFRLVSMSLTLSYMCVNSIFIGFIYICLRRLYACLSMRNR